MLRKPLLLAIDDEPGMLALIQRFAGPAGFDTNAARLTSGGSRVLALSPSGRGWRASAASTPGEGRGLRGATTPLGRPAFITLSRTTR